MDLASNNNNGLYAKLNQIKLKHLIQRVFHWSKSFGISSFYMKHRQCISFRLLDVLKSLPEGQFRKQ